MWGAKHFRAYLYGHKCVVYTDHCPLKSMLSVQHPSGKLARWSQSLTELDLESHYRPGRLNANADALSRVPVSSGLGDQEESEEVQVAHLSADGESAVQRPTSEILALQEADPEGWQILMLIRDGGEPGDSVQGFILKGIDRFSSIMWMWIKRTE